METNWYVFLLLVCTGVCHHLLATAVDVTRQAPPPVVPLEGEATQTLPAHTSSTESGVGDGEGRRHVDPVPAAAARLTWALRRSSPHTGTC